MRVFHQRITIINYRRPAKKELNAELQFFGNALGLFGDRDKEKSCFRIFIELLKSTRKNHPLSSDEIAARTHLSRGTVIHHINKLIESGLAAVEDSHYLLRAGNLESVMEEIQKDTNRTLEDLKQIAHEIDGELGP